MQKGTGAFRKWWPTCVCDPCSWSQTARRADGGQVTLVVAPSGKVWTSWTDLLLGPLPSPPRPHSQAWIPCTFAHPGPPRSQTHPESTGHLPAVILQKTEPAPQDLLQAGVGQSALPLHSQQLQSQVWKGKMKVGSFPGPGQFCGVLSPPEGPHPQTRGPGFTAHVHCTGAFLP